jgi:hypothetical protein
MENEGRKYLGRFCFIKGKGKYGKIIGFGPEVVGSKKVQLVVRILIPGEVSTGVIRVYPEDIELKHELPSEFNSNKK